MLYLERCTRVSFVILLLAIIQSSLAIFSFWPLEENNVNRYWFGILELATMMLLIINALFITYSVSHFNNSQASHISRLCLYSLIFCFFGDIVNRNFSQHFYQYDEIIKHSYLVDSIFFFGPGYLILFIAVTQLVLTRGIKTKFITVTTIIAMLISVITYIDMYISDTSIVLTIITGGYALLITALATSGIWLLKSFNGLKSPRYIWIVFIGLLLAMLADAIIGAFWIFGNNGLGYFPLVSHVNWFIYIASQAFIQQLPRAIIESQK